MDKASVIRSICTHRSRNIIAGLGGELLQECSEERNSVVQGPSEGVQAGDWAVEILEDLRRVS